MKKLLKWLIVLALIAGLGLAVGRALKARKAREQAASQALATRTVATLELAATDVTPARVVPLEQGLAVSGSLRAVNSAWVKARVAGEIRALALREGDRVRAGQVVARIDAAEYASRVTQARRQADAARAQIDIARRVYENNKALVAQGFISKTALDTSLASLEGAKATYQAALAAVDVARKALADTELRSPISGLVGQRPMQNGERAGVDARILEVVDLSAMELEAAIPPAEAMSLRVGQQAELTVEGGNQPFTAKVVRINPIAQAGSRSVLAYLRVDHPEGLRQGLFAQGRIVTARAQVLAIPLASVRTDRPEPYVQLVRADRIAYQRVSLGARGTVDGEPMVGVDGIDAGARVLVGSLGSLREGTPVHFTGTPATAVTPATAPSATSAKAN
ncbi:MAG: efflux RND transporter periplasmic adaptor subunit [Burkholderiaceae bacterium]